MHGIPIEGGFSQWSGMERAIDALLLGPEPDPIHIIQANEKAMLPGMVHTGPIFRHFAHPIGRQDRMDVGPKIRSGVLCEYGEAQPRSEYLQSLVCALGPEPRRLSPFLDPIISLISSHLLFLQYKRQGNSPA